MSITDELRDWAHEHLYKSGIRSDLLAIADRIDAEHERLMRERRGCIHYDQERHYCNVHDLTTEDYKRGYDDGFASADDWLGQHESDMAEHGWIRLPKDADGVPIHVGDEMEFSAFEVEKPVTRTVDGIGQGVFFAWCGERGYQQHEAKRYCHYHAPTVEDVLREFAEKIIDSQIPSIHPTYEEAIAEFAAKLRLAEGEDE